MSTPGSAATPPGGATADATRNEQTKLLATAVNNIAVALVVIGVVTPVTALSFGMFNAPPLTFGTATFAAIWLCTGGSLHWVALTHPAEPQAVNSG